MSALLSTLKLAARRAWNHRLLMLCLLAGLVVGCQTPQPQPSTVTITFTDFENVRLLYERRIAKFDELSLDISVQFVPLDQVMAGANVDHRLMASLADTMALPALPQGAEANYFLDLDPFIESDSSFSTDAFWPSLLNGCQVGGHKVGLPTSVQVSLILFDKTAFDSDGVPYPAPGWTWDNFQHVARTLTQRSGSQITRYGFVDSGQPLSLLGPLVDTVVAGGDAARDSAALVQALNWYVSLAREGIIPVFGEGEDAAVKSESLIYSGQAAMWVGRVSDLPQLRTSLKGEVGLAPFPIAADGSASNTSPATASCVAISAGTTHSQEAWAWLKFLTTDPLQREPGDVSGRIAVAEQRAYWWDDLADQTETTLRFALAHAWYGDLSSDAMSAIGEALNQAMRGEKDLSAALAAIDVTPSTPVPADTADVSIAVATPIPTTVPTTNTALPNSTVTVDYYADFMLHTDINAVKSLAKTFNQTHSNITINVSEQRDLVPTGPEPLKIDNAYLAQRFDCYPQNTATARLFKDSVYSLNPLIEADAEGKALLDDLPASLLNLSRVDGEQYGLPVATRPTVMYYNADHLVKMGLEPPALNWTVDDFWSLATATASGKTFGFVPWRRGPEGIDFLLASRNIQLYDVAVQPAILNFDNPTVVSLVSQVVDMADARVMFPIDEGGTRTEWGNREERQILITAGNAAFWTEVAGLRYGFFSGDPRPPDFKVGVAPVPWGAGPLAPASSDIALYISRRAVQPAACWEWIKFLSAQPNVFVGIPARRSVIESARLEAAVGPDAAAAYRVVLAQPRRSVVTDLVSLYKSSPFLFWWEDALADTFAGVDPTSALAELQRKAEAYLACMATVDNSKMADQWTVCAEEVDPGFLDRE